MTTQLSRSLVLCISGLVLGTFSGCGAVNNVAARIKPAKGDGNIETSTRDIEEYSSIEVHNAIELDWQPSDSTTLEVSVDRNLAQFLETKVTDGHLIIKFTKAVVPTETVTVKTTSPALKAIEGDGATQIKLFDIASDGFRVGLSGSSQCTAAGNVAHLGVYCSGSAQFTGRELASQSAELEASGSAVVKVDTVDLQSIAGSGSAQFEARDISSKTLKVTTSGSVHCDLSGQADRLIVNASGAARVDAPDLDLETVDVNLSGAAEVLVGKAKKTRANTSGAAKLEFDDGKIQSN